MKWRRSRFALRLAILASTATMLVACTLASGWTDLQGGQTDAGLDPVGETAKDAATSDRTTTGDANVSTGVPCGAQTCTGTNGCCVSLGAAARSCTDHDTCDPGATKRFLLCTHGGQCPSTRPNCCLQFPEWGSSCENGCKSGSDLLCDPAHPEQCPANTTCLLFSSTPDIYSCQ